MNFDSRIGKFEIGVGGDGRGDAQPNESNGDGNEIVEVHFEDPDPKIS